jgi:hypothetical protein
LKKNNKGDEKMKKIILNSKKIAKWEDIEKVKFIEFIELEELAKEFYLKEDRHSLQGMNFHTLEEVIKFIEKMSERINFEYDKEELEKERVEKVFGGLITSEYKKYKITKKVVWDNRETKTYHFYIVNEVEFYNKKTHYHPKLRAHKEFIKENLCELKHEYINWREYKAENGDYSPITAEEMLKSIKYLKEKNM